MGLIYLFTSFTELTKWQYSEPSVMRVWIELSRILFVPLPAKTNVRSQLRTVRSHPYTLESGLSVVFKSRAFAVRHKTLKRGPFRKSSLTEWRSLLQKSLSFK